MNYSIANKLKNVGFPQFGDGNALILNFPIPESDETVTVIPWPLYVHNPMPTREVVYAPTLEELIAACGKAIGGIVFAPDGHCVVTTNWDYAQATAEGTTPTEAVARLWLALNSHETNSRKDRPSDQRNA